jgi:hypothetical protein
VGSVGVLVGSGGFWCSSDGVLVEFLWVLVSSCGLWWVLVGPGAVLMGFGGALVGSCEGSGRVLVGSGGFWWVLVQF